MYEKGKWYVYVTSKKYGKTRWNVFGVKKEVAEIYAKEFRKNPNVIRVDIVKE